MRSVSTNSSNNRLNKAADPGAHHDPQLSPRPLHHDNCIKAVKHGYANRDICASDTAAATTSSTAWECDPSQQLSLDVASWNAVCCGAWPCSYRRRYSRRHDMVGDQSERRA